MRVDDAVDLGRLGSDVGLPDVAAGVDDGDLDPRRGTEHRVGYAVDVRGRVLPLVRDPGPVHVPNAGLGRLRLGADKARDRP